MRSVCGASPALYIVAGRGHEEPEKSSSEREAAACRPDIGQRRKSTPALTEIFPASDPTVRYTELAPDRFRDFWRD